MWKNSNCNTVQKYLILIIFALFISIYICSCASNNGSGQTTTNEDMISVDPKERYYVSEVYSLGVDGYILEDILDSDDGKIAELYTYDAEQVYSYKLCLYDSSSKKWGSYIDIDNSGVILGGFCPIANDRVVASTYYGFDVFDLNTGALVGQNNDLFVLLNENLPKIFKRDNGFVIVKSDCLYLIGEDYKEESKIDLPEAGMIPFNAYFYRDGKDYLVLEIDGCFQYYEVDFDGKTITPLCTNEDLGLGYFTVYDTGGYAFDSYKGIIYELDPSNKTKKELAYTENMLIKPILSHSFDPEWRIFGENDYVIIHHNFSRQTEVLFMVTDTEYDLSQRTRLSVRGYGAGNDVSLSYAAYLYNTSQNKYLINIENYDEDEYGYQNATEAQESRLKLLKDFTSGKAPDIFYGNGFDYDQMGRSGLVMDLSDYIKDSKNINEDMISKNIYDLYYEDGHCYKLFPGYSMYGLWSSEEFTGNNDNMTLEDLESSTYSSRIFGDEYACNIADYAIRYPIKRLIKDGEFIDETELEKIIKFAIDNGNSPSSAINYFASSSTVGSKETTVYPGYISYINVYHSEQYGMEKELRFVGFPTLNGSVHVACPFGLVAVSAGTDHPEECMKFIEFLFSDEVQKADLVNNIIPVNKAIYDEVLDIALDRSKIGDDMYYRMFFGDTENGATYTQEEVESYRRATESVDTIMIMDWGLYNIIAEEVNSYYSQHKDIKDIAHSMRSRIELYIEENYK